MEALSDERRPSRLVGGLNAGSLLGWLKSLLGGTAAKLAVAGAVVGAVGIAAGVPLVRPHTATAKPKIVPARHAPARSVGSASATQSPRHAPSTKAKKARARTHSGGTLATEPGTTPAESPSVGEAGTTTPPAGSPPATTVAPGLIPPAVVRPPAGSSPVQVPTPPVVNDTVSSVAGTAQQVVSQLPAIVPPALPQVPSLPTVTLPKLGP
jgi:hypothetical protein